MRKIVRYTLLLIPLFFWVLMWLGVVFGIDLLPDGLLRDDTYEYSGDGAKPTGLISQSWFNFVCLLAIIPGSFLCMIYTAFKRMWRWLAVYIMLAGLPIVGFIIGGIIR